MGLDITVYRLKKLGDVKIAKKKLKLTLKKFLLENRLIMLSVGKKSVIKERD